MTTRITESISPNFDIQYGSAELTGPNTFTCRLDVIRRGQADKLAHYIGTGATDDAAQQDARRKAIDAIAALDGPLMLPAGPEDEMARNQRQHRQNNFGFTSEPVRGDFIMFEGERVYRFTQNGHQETAVLSLAPHEARKLFDRLASDFGFAGAAVPVRKPPLAQLEGRPIFEGDTLYDRQGERMVAHSYDQPGFPLLMVPIDNDSDHHRSHSWATGTHQDGEQVLFWTNPREAK